MIIYAPDKLEYDKPTIFLAGPIQGATEWHTNAIKLFNSIDDICIASPKRINGLKDNFNYNEQVNWETKHLNKASENGVILFWLEEEKEFIPGRAYAQTTRFEIAEWLSKYKYNNNINLSIGISPKFTGRRYIKYRTVNDYGLPVHNTLEDTVKHAVNFLI